MDEPHEFTDSFANTSCRKLLAFPLKNYECPVANPCNISNANRLISFVTCIESLVKVREEKYVVVIMGQGREQQRPYRQSCVNTGER